MAEENKKSEEKLRDLLSQNLPVGDKTAKDFKIIGDNSEIVISRVTPNEE